MLAWTEKENCRGLSEQPNDIRVATKSCNMHDMKHIISITGINRNHNSSTALERSVLNNWGGGLKQAPYLTLFFCSGSQHLVSCSVLVVNL